MIKGECKKCGQKHNLSRHHIIPKTFGGSNRKSNKVILCRNCHNLLEVEIQRGEQTSNKGYRLPNDNQYYFDVLYKFLL